jgi:hypothetical protein
MIAKLADKYQLNDIVFASFILQYGFRSRYCAADVVYAMLANLESTVSCIWCSVVLFLYLCVDLLILLQSCNSLEYSYYKCCPMMKKLPYRGLVESIETATQHILFSASENGLL